MVNTAIRIIHPHIQAGRNGGKGHGPNRDAAIRKNSPLNSICASSAAGHSCFIESLESGEDVSLSVVGQTV